MLGFDDNVQPASEYSLVSEQHTRHPLRTKGAVLAMTLLGLVGSVAVFGSQPAPAAHITSGQGHASPSLTMLASSKDGKASENAVCSTTPWGPCRLNLTMAGLNDTAHCCPDSFHCTMLGPIFGLCMPGAFAPGTAAFDSLLGIGGDTLPLLAKKPPSKPAEEPTACATKPFGQCAGMNFTAPKAERAAHNFSTVAEPFACCPTGTSCVSFGPVYGQCMPSWVAATVVAVQ